MFADDGLPTLVLLPDGSEPENASLASADIVATDTARHSIDLGQNDINNLLITIDDSICLSDPSTPAA